MKTNLQQLFEQRRSIYDLGSKPILSNAKISELIEEAVKFCPSAFNSQSARVVILYGDEYQKFWQIALDELKKLIPSDKFAPTESKIKSFTTGLGTILFFEDTATIQNLQQQYPLYQDNFPKWSLQSSGMLQYMVWTSLAEQKIGASLQHYNPLVDEKVHQLWQIPPSWQLLGQMPFGSIEKPADEKSFLPIDERVKIF